MADRVDVEFVKLEAPQAGSAVLLSDQNLKLGAVAAAWEKAAGGRFARAAAAAKYQGKATKALQLLAPGGVELDRLVVVGMGEVA